MTALPQPAEISDLKAARRPLDEIRALVRNDLPRLPAHEPPAALRDLAGLWRWLADAQHKSRPSISRPRLAIFLSRHGAFPGQQETLPLLLSELEKGNHASAALARAANADLQVYELDLARPSRDFRAGTALNEDEAAQAVAYGMMTMQPGVDLLLVSAPNPVADLASTEIRRALKAGMDPFDALMRFGGFDIAAMAGAIVAARLARVPVVLEGAAAEAAADILAALQEDAAAHTRKSSALLWERTELPAPCRGALLIPFLKSLALVST